MPIALWAQRPLPQERQRELQMQMTEASLSEMRMRLNLTDEQMSRLRPVYKQYQKKVAHLNMLNHRLFNRVNADTLSDEQARTLLKGYIDREQKLYNLNKRYMNDLLQILTPQQVIGLYQSDSFIKWKIRKEYLRRAERPRKSK